MEFLLQQILSTLQSIDSKLDDIKGYGLYNSVADVCEKLDGIESKIDEVKGYGIYNSIADVHDKLSSMQGNLPYSIEDIFDQLQNLN